MPGFRMLSRDELIEAIEEAERGRSGASRDEASEEPDERRGPSATRRTSARRRGGGARRGRRGGRGRSRARSASPRARRGRRGGGSRGRRAEPEDDAEVETEEVTGVLDRMPQGYGFLRLSGLERRTRATSTSAPPRSAAASCAPATRSAAPRASRAAASATARWSGSSRSTARSPRASGCEFEDLTAVAPTRRLPLGEGEPLARAVDLLAPLAFGQRVLVLAEPRSGRSTLLRSIGARSPAPTPTCGSCSPTSAPRR